MKAGKVRISNKLIADVLKFPIQWEIVKISDKPSSMGFTSEMIIEGDDFPEVVDGEIKEVLLIIHKENITFEVKEIV